MEMAGSPADPWQRDLIANPPHRTLLLCSRSAGKSEAAAALATVTAIRGKALVLLVSPTDRQSGELMLKVRRYYDGIGRAVQTTKETDHELRFANGSRVVALPGKEGTIRTYNGVALLVIDEAARVPDALYYTVRPMLATSAGSLLALSTPKGCRGWFWDSWANGGKAWTRIAIPASECPRISPEFLAEEREANPARWYRQEYELSFEADAGAEFDPELIAAAMRQDVKPLFG